MKFFQLISLLTILLIASSCKKDSTPEVIPATYTVSYKVNHDGRYFIEIPRVYEFAHIVLAIKDMETPSLFIQKGTDYYQRVTNQFFQFRFNDIFYQYRFDYTDMDSYFSVGLNSYKYEYYYGQLESKDVYNIVWNPDIFTPQLTLIKNLYVQADFETFYTENESYYQQQIQLYDSIVPVNMMWDWLEAQFNTHVNSYTILISPLTNEKHATKRFITADFKETLLFISGFHKELQALDTINISRKIGSAFVEMDADYIIPASDQYVSTIATAMSRRVIWKDNLELNGQYDTPYKIFNMYMTWATYCLFVKENYSPRFFEMVNSDVETYMVDEMGFIRFKDFKNKLISLYTGDNIENLYPALLHWVDEVNDN